MNVTSQGHTKLFGLSIRPPTVPGENPGFIVGPIIVPVPLNVVPDCTKVTLPVAPIAEIAPVQKPSRFRFTETLPSVSET